MRRLIRRFFADRSAATAIEYALITAGISIVIVTHNMQQAARVSDYTAFFLSEGGPGRLVEMGSTSEIFSNPKDQRTLDYVTGRFG